MGLGANHTVPHTKKDFSSQKSEWTADIAGMIKCSCYISSLSERLENSDFYEGVVVTGVHDKNVNLEKTI